MITECRFSVIVNFKPMRDINVEPTKNRTLPPKSTLTGNKKNHYNNCKLKFPSILHNISLSTVSSEAKDLLLGHFKAVGPEKHLICLQIL